MHRRIRIAAVAAAAAAMLIAGARSVAVPLLAPALGFAAKVTCSGVLVGGATVPQVRAGFPDARLRSVVRVRVDTVAGGTRASVPLLGSRRAVHRPGLGCTLDPVTGGIAGPAALPALQRTPVRADAPWPDGTATVVADVTGFDTALLHAAVEAAFADGTGTHALVVARRGRIIVERYAGGYTREHRFPGWSMAKSVTNALAGILAGDGLLDLDASGIRPEWRRSDDGRRHITLRQLMQMSSGLEFDESYTPQGGATRMLFNSADAAATAAQSPLRHEPGTHWYYSSGTTNIISAHLRERIGDDTAYLRYPAERLFAQLGMHSAVLEPDASGTFVGSSFLYATAQDWARFGLLYLRDGIWNGRRILPEGWVAWSITPAPAATRGQYGAQWWLNAGASADTTRRTWPDLPRDSYWASGFQGQYVVVLPSHDMVVVRLGVDPRTAWRLADFLRALLAAQS